MVLTEEGHFREFIQRAEDVYLSEICFEVLHVTHRYALHANVPGFLLQQYPT